MSKKFLFVDATGAYEESAGAYEVADHIDTSAGAADAGKPIVLDADGNIDASMINDADIDHGNLTGLADDDHTQYILVDGTRAFTGDQSMGGNQLTSVGDPVTTTIDSASDDAVPMSFLASTASGEGASLSGIEDSGGYFTSNNVEGALQELGATGNSPVYTTDGTGVTKADVLYVSANDTVSTFATITADERAVGLAYATTGAASSVVVAQDGTIHTGVLTTATAGDTYYWNGSAHSTTIPAGGGAYVWQTGYAKNASDLHQRLLLIKKNSA